MRMPFDVQLWQRNLYIVFAVEIASEIGARSVLGQAHLGLGLLHRAKGRKEKARESIYEAIEIFEEIGATGFLKQAREAMAALG